MEQTNLFGQLDLTALSNLCKQHPQLVKEVQFKDGVHRLLNIDVAARQQPSDHGHTHYIKASCKKDQQMQGVKYYLADLKPSTYGNQQMPFAPQGNNNDLVF